MDITTGYFGAGGGGGGGGGSCTQKELLRLHTPETAITINLACQVYFGGHLGDFILNNFIREIKPR